MYLLNFSLVVLFSTCCTSMPYFDLYDHFCSLLYCDTSDESEESGNVYNNGVVITLVHNASDAPSTGTPAAQNGTPPAPNGAPPASNGAPPASNGAPPASNGAPPASNGAPPASNGPPPAPASNGSPDNGMMMESRDARMLSANLGSGTNILVSATSSPGHSGTNIVIG